MSAAVLSALLGTLSLFALVRASRCYGFFVFKVGTDFQRDSASFRNRLAAHDFQPHEWSYLIALVWALVAVASLFAAGFVLGRAAG